MELNQIRYFLSLAETLNFTRAADACGVTQPALTRLTPLGEAMRAHLQTIWAAATAARDTADAIRRGGRHRLRVGLVRSLALGPFLPMLAEVSRLRDAVDLSVIRGEGEDLYAALLDDGIDAAIVCDDERMPDRLHRWPLFEEGFVVAMAADHPLSRLERVPADDLAGTAVVRPFPAAFRPPPAVEAATGPMVDDEADAQCLAGAGLGVAILGADSDRRPGLVARPLDDGAAGRRILLAVVAGRPRSPAAETFVRLARVAAWDRRAA